MPAKPNIQGYIGFLLTALTLIYLLFCFIGALEYSYDIQSIVVHFFILLACILIARQILLLLSAWVEKGAFVPNWMERSEDYPTISILMPAFNEEEVIEPALRNLLSLNYENYEVIMIDDGSTDNTVAIVEDVVARKNPRRIPIRIIAQSNAGKANALNTGLIHASGEFIMCVDSDSRITANSLLSGLRYFQNPRIAAVAGNIVVANQTNLLTWFQHLEYLISQNFLRRGLSLFGVVTVIPGPIGLFRKEAISQAGGYSEDKNMFAEDADLSVRLLALGWYISSDEKMQAYTEAPDTINSMLRQRYRWKRGIYQVLKTNFYSLIVAPGIRRPLVAVLLVLEGFLFEVLGFGITVFMLTNIIFLGEVKILLGWLAVLFFLDVLVLLLVTPPKQFFKWLPLLILQKLTYTFALQTWGVLALLDEWRSSRMTWDKVERLGALTLQEKGNV